MHQAQDVHARLAALRLLYRVAADLNAVRDLTATLQAVADAVVSSLGFGIAVVNVVRPDGDLEVAAVAGSEESRQALSGRVGSRADWERLLASGEGWGSLRFIPEGSVDPGDIPSYIPDLPVVDEPDAWHPLDVLLAPLRAPGGELVGVISVDEPANGKRPGEWQCELLEMFAMHAAIAIDNARLHTEARQALARLEQEQAALRASEESFRLAFENAPSGMAMTSLRPADHGRLMRVNEALCDMLGYPELLLRRLGLATVTHPEDRELLDAGQRGAVRHARLSRAAVAPARPGHGDPSGRPRAVGRLRARRLGRAAPAPRRRHGPVGGVALVDRVPRGPNRAELRVRLERLLAARTTLGVLFCDLDDFKTINDTYGHHAGDAVLVEVAVRLQSGVRDGDTVARVGGDEFVVLAGGLGPGDVEDLAARLAATVSAPFEYEGQQIPISASVGISWSDGASQAEDLMRAADRHMYERKRARTKPRAVS
ncbi:diguanylate cyclase domain-containing protein [Carbonactinospora thermoautotrophica]|uniref:GGDEF domain-containing protein n=1 Tax=Carbonactinospora thermoautotrophica TaxID=1469144 RepID=UPI003DA8E654